jgi:creatinine amidohydrolase/Fe(II)-dependent formamide hydrolase-like protein
MKTLSILCGLLFITLTGQSQIYYVQDMSTTQIDSLDRERTVVLLPGGILEEHGPYLPSSTDGYMNLALTNSVANTIIKTPGMKVLIFPLLPLGNGGANEIGRKYNFPGTFTVRKSTLRSVLMDWSSEIGEKGFKKLFVIHMHGAPNHNRAIDEACGYFNDTYKGRMVNIWNLGFRTHAPSMDSTSEKEDGFTVHAGASEHSMLYYLQPRFLKLYSKNAPAVTAANPGQLDVLAKKDGWPGYWGSPRLATVAYGKLVWDAWVQNINEQVIKVLNGTYDFAQPTYGELQSKNPAQKSVDEDAARHDQ